MYVCLSRLYVHPSIYHSIYLSLSLSVCPSALISRTDVNLFILYKTQGAGCSSVDSVPPFEAVGRRIDPSQWTQLQFGLFSVPTSGPQLVYQRPWYVLFCLWKSAYKRSLAAYRKE